ncbi:MAG TPA: PEP/pyruvate-binding domain-containing protein [Vicinamibacterales bacterium]|nr:PEP/pyruvate-binding domain-containing protein [Vicinamibacterales bacterium]
MRVACDERIEIEPAAATLDATERILPLARARDVHRAGGKASNLAALSAIGQPVPHGFVIVHDAFDTFLRHDDLGAVIEAECCGLRATSAPAEIRQTADRIAARVRAAALPAALRRQIDRALADLRADKVIVRSSGIGEDSADASFAGQFDSIANVCGPTAAHHAVVDVLASRWSARALTYQLRRKRAIDGMAVIVQRQIDAVLSGVLFTVSPANAEQMLIEYCEGLGDALVGGRVNPSQVAVDRRSLEIVRHDAPLDASVTSTRLDDRSIRSIAEHALRIERGFGRPQDIEWTLDADGRLWIVQARPITVTRPVPAAGSAQPRTRARRTVVWSNANVNENFPQPISPLLYSIARTGYYHYFRNLGLAFGVSKPRIAAMEQPLRHIIGVHGARMYYNLTSIHGVLRSAPFGEHLAAWFNRFVGAEDTETAAFVDMPARRTGLRGAAASLGQALELAVIAAKTTWQCLFITRRIERFERTVTEFAARTHPTQLQSRSLPELIDDLRGFIDIRNHRWIDASLADAASMVCYGALERWLARACPETDQGGLHNTLLKALPNLPSSMPALELWSLSRLVAGDRRLADLLDSAPPAEAIATIRREPAFAPFARALDRFLDDWGFRCSGELMLTVASFQEDPAPLLAIIRAYAAQDGPSPADHLRAQQADRVAQTERMAAILRTRRLLDYVPVLSEWHATAVLVRWTQGAIVLRERARLKQALLYSRLRRIVLAIGDRLVEDGRLAVREDVFLLTAQEIDDLIAGAAMFPHHVRALVEARRRWFADATAATPPDSLRLGEGEYYSPSRPASVAAAAAATGGDAILRGLGVCGGQTTARAAVLSDVTDTHRLRQGDVLVTRQTDPGWGAVFPLISGLIMERGGMLSHGAIIAREFGIPSVVGIARATEVVEHGATVHIDGDLGIVRLEERPAAALPA